MENLVLFLSVILIGGIIAFFIGKHKGKDND